ncbi:unnamed protein product [Porites evermanni]|uniref:Uncharacterized protein n=1 Tax=Porites evermanni TaxID=104178 RepID=A0ABN8SR28_9CNID|nr:unnamed protein product [Porites evermanni]
MEKSMFPPVLTSLIKSISTESQLYSWHLNSTLEAYSLTIEWARIRSIGKKENVSQHPQQIVNEENSPQDTALFSTDCGMDAAADKDMDDNVLKKNLQREDIDVRCVVRNAREDENETEVIIDQGECDVPEAITTENKVDYKTQRSFQPGENSKAYKRRDKRENFDFLPGKQTAFVAAEHEDGVTNKISGCFSKPDDNIKKAICSCGETFSSRRSSLSHLLSNCPVSLCFRIDLECDVRQVIDGWHGDGKNAAEAWWQGYKKNGFPDEQLKLKDENIDCLSALMDNFIKKPLLKRSKIR